MTIQAFAEDPHESGNIYHLPEEALRKEGEWITRAKINPADFAPLYHRYHEPIFRFVFRRMNEKEDAFDVTSQVFMKALNNIGKYEIKGLPFSAWLYRIALNEVNMFYRKSKSSRAVSMDDKGMQFIYEEMEDENISQYHDKMMDKLSFLKEDEMQLIQMRFFEKMPFREIADILSMTENNAKVKTYRILDKLKKTILAK